MYFTPTQYHARLSNPSTDEMLLIDTYEAVSRSITTTKTTTASTVTLQSTIDAIHTDGALQARQIADVKVVLISAGSWLIITTYYKW